MDVVLALSGVGTVLGGTAAWAGIASPRARAARSARATRVRQQREVHEALFGTPERRDDAKALIAAEVPGLLANMHVVMAKLNAPMLNGKGDDLIATVDRLDRRSKRDGARITKIEQHLRAPQ